VEAAIPALRWTVPNIRRFTQEIREELVPAAVSGDQNTVAISPKVSSTANSAILTFSGFEVTQSQVRTAIQNDQLTFRLAGDYDLWFHAPEIPGEPCATTSKGICAG